jgi:Xaa-Pro aminopeptidase
MNEFPLGAVILISNPVNVFYLTGFSGSFSFVVMQKISEFEWKKYLISDARYIGFQIAENFDCEVLDFSKDPFLSLGEVLGELAVSMVYFEAEYMTFATLDKFKEKLPQIDFQKFSGLIEAIRSVKTSEEIIKIEQAQNLGLEIFENLKGEVSFGQSELEIATLIRRMALDRGVEMAFDPIVAINENSAVPHHKACSKCLSSGDLVLIDMGVKKDFYCGDFTRMLCFGVPSAKFVNIYEVVKSAYEFAFDKIATASDAAFLDNAVRNLFSSKDLLANYLHSLGHGIGLEVHEAPHLSFKSKDKLRLKNVFTIEPGIYFAGEFGVRLENICVKEVGGVRVLGENCDLSLEKFICR